VTSRPCFSMGWYEMPKEGGLDRIKDTVMLISESRNERVPPVF